MANKHMQRCSTSVVIRETEIKTTMKYHFTPTRKGIMKEIDNGKCWQERGELELLYITVGK